MSAEQGTGLGLSLAYDISEGHIAEPKAKRRRLGIYPKFTTIKHFYFPLILACCLNVTSLAQKISNDTFYLSKIPEHGILLDKGWKFHAGDNAEWAGPGYDDSQWKNLNPDIDIHHLLKQNKDAGIGWFRLKIKVDSSVQDSSAALVISQVVASEIYLNGQLLYSFGTVSADYNKEKTYTLRDRPFIIRFARQSTQELAIRYSFNSKNFLILFESNPCARLILKSSSHGFADHTSKKVQTFSLFLVLISISLFPSLFCLSVYFSFRNEKGFLYTGLYTLGQVVTGIIFMNTIIIGNSISLSSFNFIVIQIISLFCVIIVRLKLG